MLNMAQSLRFIMEEGGERMSLVDTSHDNEGDCLSLVAEPGSHTANLYSAE